MMPSAVTTNRSLRENWGRSLRFMCHRKMGAIRRAAMAVRRPDTSMGGNSRSACLAKMKLIDQIKVASPATMYTHQTCGPARRSGNDRFLARRDAANLLNVDVVAEPGRVSHFDGPARCCLHLGHDDVARPVAPARGHITG